MIRKKRLLSLLLAMMMVFTIFAPGASALRLEMNPRCSPDLYLKANNYPKAGVSNSVDWNGLTACLYSGIKSYKATVDISKYKVPVDDDNIDYLSKVVHVTPKFLKVISSYTYSSVSGQSGKTVGNVYLTYRYSKDGCAMMRDYADISVKKITSDIKANPYLSDAEKVLLVHDRLDALCDYDYANYEDKEAGLIKDLAYEDYSAYGPLVLWVGVCDGYSAAMSMCLEVLGIKSCIVSSATIDHSWNIVYLDGMPYYVDSTWDDPVYDVTGRALHNNLLVSASKLKTNHAANDYPVVNAPNSYDNWYWTCSDTAFQLIGDNLYYINNRNGTLCRREHDGRETVLKTIGGTWYADKSGRYWLDSFSRLASYKDLLIYSTTTQVYTYNVNTGETKVLYSPAIADPSNCWYIYGMTVKDCMLYIDVYNTPNFDRYTKQRYQYRIELDHQKKSVPAQTRTYCTDTGRAAGTVCGICGKVFSGMQTIPATEHVWGTKTLSAKATASKDGKFVAACQNCPATKTTAIPKVSGISLSNTSYVYDGKVKTPAVTVKDRGGNTVASKYYTVTRSNKSSKAIGKYTVTVTLKGNYSGTKKLTYKITPARPQNLKLTDVTTTTVSMKWDKAKYAKYYRLQCSYDKGKTWLDVTNTAATSVKIIKMSPGEKIYYRVLSLNAKKTVTSGASPWLKTQTRCSAPVISSVSSPKTGAVTIKWKKTAGASKYALYWSYDAKKWSLISKTDKTSMDLINCVSGKKAYVKVKAINAYGKYSAFSKVKTVTAK